MKYKRLVTLRKVIASALCGVFLTVHCALAHATESNFWASRRVASQRMKGNGETSNSVLSTGQTLLAQLPKVTPLDFGGRSGSSQAGLGGVNEPFSIGPKTGDWLGKMVMPYGTVNDVYLSPKKDAPFIVHIQDAHGIEEAQRNISSMISLLDQEPGINLVGVEGAWGAFSVEPYRDFPDPAMTKDLAEFLLKKGMIAGPEYAGLTMPKAPTFFGAESSDLYNANVQALKTAYKDRDAAMSWVDQLKARTELLKEVDYSQTLKTFDKNFTGYQSEKIKLADYVRYLTGMLRQMNHRPVTPNLFRLEEAMDQESALDFKRVELERTRLVEKLVQKLSAAQLQELVNRSVDYRAGRMGYCEYHTHLKQICQNSGISLKTYPQMARYIDYVITADKIDRHALLNELDTVERSLPQSLAKTSREKELVALTYDLSLLHKLVRHEMSPTDWAHYQTRGDSLRAAAQRVAAMEPAPAEAGRTTVPTIAMEPFEDFCRLASERNTAFTTNIAQRMAETKTKSSILIAGGFHTEGLSALLRQKQISYVVVTPRITTIPKDNNYLDVLARDPVPLEQLLAGDRIYLASLVALASRDSVAHQIVEALKTALNTGKAYVGKAKRIAITTSKPADNKYVEKLKLGNVTFYLVNNYAGAGSIVEWITQILRVISLSKKGIGQLKKVSGVVWKENAALLAGNIIPIALATLFDPTTALLGGIFIVYGTFVSAHMGVIQKAAKKRMISPFVLFSGIAIMAIPLVLLSMSPAIAFLNPELMSTFINSSINGPFSILASASVAAMSGFVLHHVYSALADSKWWSKSGFWKQLLPLLVDNRDKNIFYERPIELINRQKVIKVMFYTAHSNQKENFDPDFVAARITLERLKSVDVGNQRGTEISYSKAGPPDNGRGWPNFITEFGTVQPDIVVVLGDEHSNIVRGIVKKKSITNALTLTIDNSENFEGFMRGTFIPKIIPQIVYEDPGEDFESASIQVNNLTQPDLLPVGTIIGQGDGARFRKQFTDEEYKATEWVNISAKGNPNSKPDFKTTTNVRLPGGVRAQEWGLSSVTSNDFVVEIMNFSNSLKFSAFSRYLISFLNLPLGARKSVEGEKMIDVQLISSLISDYGGTADISHYLHDLLSSVNPVRDFIAKPLSESIPFSDNSVRNAGGRYNLVRQHFLGLPTETPNVNNIFYYILRLFLEEDLAKKWAMRLLPVEISGLGVAGWFATEWAQTLLGGVMAVDPTMMGVFLMAAGILVFRGFHFAVDLIQGFRPSAQGPPARGFWSNTGRMLPYAILPVLATSPFFFVVAFSVLAYDHYAFDSKQLFNKILPYSPQAKTRAISMVFATFGVLVAPIVLAQFTSPLGAFLLISFATQAVDPAILHSFSDNPAAGIAALVVGTASNFSTYALSMGWASMAILGFATSSALSNNVFASVKKFMSGIALVAALFISAPAQSMDNPITSARTLNSQGVNPVVLSEDLAKGAVFQVMGPLVKFPENLLKRTPLSKYEASPFTGMSQQEISNFRQILQTSAASSAGENVGLLIAQASGPNTRITLNFIKFEQWEREMQLTAQAILKGLLEANQPVLIVSQWPSSDEALAKLSVTYGKESLIVHQKGTATTTMTDVENEYGKNGIPLAQTVVTRSGTEDSFTKNTRYIPLFIETIANSIFKELQELLVALRAA